MTDPFLHDDAPYVLGALSDSDRDAFEAHLLECGECRARVAELRPTADLLAGVLTDPAAWEAPAPMPETLLPGLLRRAARERRRRRTLIATIGAAAAACAIALVVVAWPGGTSSPAPSAARTLQSVRPNPLTVTARLTAKAWGTEIRLHCSYPSYEHERLAYDLVVVDRGRRVHEAGDWTLVPGKGGIDFVTGTSVPRGEIGQLVIRTASGTPLLELRL